MKVLVLAVATVAWGSAWARPPQFNARAAVVEQIPTGSVVTSLSQAPLLSHSVDSGQGLQVDDIFQRITGRKLTDSDTVVAAQPASASVLDQQVIQASSEDLNRQGFVGILDDFGASAENTVFFDDTIFENPQLDTSNFIINNPVDGTSQSDSQSLFIVGGLTSAAPGVPAGGVSLSQANAAVSSNAPSQASIITGVPLHSFTLSSDSNSLTGQSQGDANFGVALPISTASVTSPSTQAPAITTVATRNEPTAPNLNILTFDEDQASQSSFPSSPINGDIASSILGSLLQGFKSKITNPSQTLGSFLRKINGQNGIFLLPGSSLRSGSSDSSDSSSSSSSSSFSIDFDFGGPEDETAADTTSGSSDTFDITFDSFDDASSGRALDSEVKVETTTKPIEKVETPVSLFRGPLSDILFTKGQWLGTLIGGLMDVGSIVVEKIREGRTSSSA